MAGDIQVRTVRVELLRAGPAHNQLLSPLTTYLGVCDDAEAGVVNVPFEQHVFERRMRALRHEALSDDEGVRPPRQDHLPDLRDLGVAMARLLGAVPRLPGALAGDPNGRDTVVRLSLTLSASELAGLPFELAKVPIGPDAWSESWLSLQSRVPVVITRRTRNASVPNQRLKWLASPRILFVSAGVAGSADVPFDQHLAALQAAVRPFNDTRSERDPRLKGQRDADGKDIRQTLGDMLTVLSNASLDGLMRECARVPYTHVHILAHGRQDDELGDRSHGLGLHPDDGVISGERLASALTGVVRGRLHRPQVVTLATCDSGNPGSVVYPGASIAHVLHQAGIPLVVASQVPLTFDASALFAREFYAGLLWGEHPWVLMHRIRASLHGRLKPDDHDWASLVVYESLPTEMDEALEEASFRQCERALQVVMARGREVAPGSTLDRCIQGLIDHGRTYAMEACALRAEVRMLQAWQAADIAAHDKNRQCADENWQHSLWCMEQALVDYERAVDGFLVNPGQGLNAPYRALLAQLALKTAALRPFDHNLWAMARHWAERTARHAAQASDRVWALGCLAQLYLLRMASPGPKDTVASLEKLAEQRLREMVLAQQRGPAPEALRWTTLQLVNIADWWTHPKFIPTVLRMRGDDIAEPTSLPKALGPAARRLLDLLDYLTAYATQGDMGEDSEAPDEPDAPAVTAAPAPVAPTGSTTALLGAPAAAAAASPLPAKPTTRPQAGEARLDIEMLPVAQGDCLWVEWGRGGQTWRLLVDCGTEGSFDDALGPRIARLPASPAQRRFELFILSHIDGDHIGGGIPLLQQAKALGLSFGDIWFNGREHLERKNMLSAKDGDDFSKLLRREKMPWNLWTKGKAVVRPVDAAGREGPLPSTTLPGNMKLTLLSPVPATLAQLAGEWDKELKKPGKRRVLAGRELEMREDLDLLVRKSFKRDGSRPNGSSIAVLLEFAGKTVLLGADAYADVLASALRLCLAPGQHRLKLDAFKVPHHGSRGNVNDELLSLIDCEHYLISTSGAVFSHPDREALARLVRRSVRPATLWFNHPLPEEDHDYHAFWARPEVQAKWKFQARHPAQPGQTFSLRWTPAKPASA